MEKVIISGADGFVGSYTVQEFLDRGKHVLALDIAPVPARLKPHRNLEYLQCDIADTSALLSLAGRGSFDTFVHFAWAGSAGPARADYDLQMQNVRNTVACLRASKELGCSRFVGAGSIMEYEVEGSVHEQGAKPSPANIYSLAKFLAHGMCKVAAAETGIELVWPIITNAYGVGELSPRFVNTTLRKIIAGEPLEFTAGTQNYDFVYVSDVARAFFLAAEKGRPFCEYVIGSGNARPLREFILEMLSSCAPGTDPHFGDVPYSGAVLPLSVYDSSPLLDDCGFKAGIGFAEGTKLTMEWLKTIGK